MFKVQFFDDGLPQSGQRTTTDQQTDLTGSDKLSSVRIEEHMDCSIVVIHVLEEPLFGEKLPGRGLCGHNLREEVVVGLIACVGEGFVIRHHVPVED